MERSIIMPGTIGKQDVISRVAQHAGIPNKQAEKVVNAFLDTVTESMERGEEVRITGFGTFKVVERAPRKGRHPRTGEEMQIPGGMRPTFSAGSRLVEATKKAGEMGRRAA
jgi:DNA-binding protein HU-beta